MNPASISTNDRFPARRPTEVRKSSLLPRQRADAAVRRGSSEDFRTSVGRLAGKRSFVLMLAGFTLYHFAAYGSLVFVPSYLVRVIESPIEQAGLYYGATSAFAVLIGSLAGGAIQDALSRRDARWIVRFPAIAFGLAAVPNCAMFLIDDLPTFLVVSTIGGVLLYAALPAARCRTPRGSRQRRRGGRRRAGLRRSC